MTEFILQFARAGGEWITERGGVLADVAERTWRQFFPRVEGGVEVDPDNELKGTLKGVYVVKGTTNYPDGRQDVIEMRFQDPEMIRDSVDGEWRPAPEEYENDVPESI